jgi:hypothetical protein
MGFFSDLMGKTSANAATALGQRNMGRINQGYDDAGRQRTTQYGTATGRLEPMFGQAQRGGNLLADTYGINGDDARQRSFETYSSDPFNAQSGQITNNLLSNIMRTNASRGMGNSGASQLAMSRAGLESQDRRIADWRQGLSGFGNQAAGLGTALAGLDTGYGDAMAGDAIGRSNALNSTDANATMAANNARMSGVNNLMSGIGFLGGQAISAFAPGGMGKSMFGGGASTGSQWVNPDTGGSWNGRSYGGFR